MAQKQSNRQIIGRPRSDKGVCQYMGEFVGNLVWSKKEINSRKANRLPHEAGLRLKRPPKAPSPLPFSATLREIRHPDWKHFLHL